MEIIHFYLELFGIVFIIMSFMNVNANTKEYFSGSLFMAAGIVFAVFLFKNNLLGWFILGAFGLFVLAIIWVVVESKYFTHYPQSYYTKDGYYFIQPNGAVFWSPEEPKINESGSAFELDLSKIELIGDIEGRNEDWKDSLCYLEMAGPNLRVKPIPIS